jgi:hypothetical protein
MDTLAMTDLEAAEMRVREEEQAYPADRSAWSIPLVDCAVRVFNAKDRVIAALRDELLLTLSLADCGVASRYTTNRVENIIQRALQG